MSGFLPGNVNSQADLEREVAGEYNTLRVYLHMLKNKKSSIREVQHALAFSSPTLAQHHLEKLCRFGLANKDHEGTYLVKSRSFGILKLYYRSGKWIVPRTVFFVVIFAFISGGFLLSISEGIPFLIASVFSLAGLLFSVYETIRFYRVLPRTA